MPRATNDHLYVQLIHSVGVRRYKLANLNPKKVHGVQHTAFDKGLDYWTPHMHLAILHRQETAQENEITDIVKQSQRPKPHIKLKPHAATSTQTSCMAWSCSAGA